MFSVIMESIRRTLVDFGSFNDVFSTTVVVERRVVNYELIWTWIQTYFGTTSQHLPTDTEENHEEFRSGQPFSDPGFKPASS